MKFIDLITEKWKASAQIGSYTVEVFEEPSKKELQTLYRRSYGNGAVRLGIQDTKRATMYVWDAEYTHQNIKSETNIKFDIGFTFLVDSPDEILVYGKDLDSFEYDVKYKDEMIKKIKKHFPKVKKIDFNVGEMKI